jgi:hypothetical protein
VITATTAAAARCYWVALDVPKAEQSPSALGQVKHCIPKDVPGGATWPVWRKTEILWALNTLEQPAELWS